MLTECPTEERISLPCNCRGFSGCHGKEGMPSTATPIMVMVARKVGKRTCLQLAAFPFPPCILSELPAYEKMLPTFRVGLPPLVSAF